MTSANQSEAPSQSPSAAGSPDAILQAAAKAFLQRYAAASHPEFLVAAYNYFFGRGLDETGYNESLVRLYAGTDRAELVETFLKSDEFTRMPAEAHQPLLGLLVEPINPPTPLPPRSTLEQYQDIWIKGRVAKKGVRECEDRFGLIRNFCSQFKRPFTILDIGANLGYFSLRLTETFDCTSMACEGIYGDWTEEVFQANENPRVILAKKIFKLADLRALAQVEHFDVVLALSVIHHLDGSFAESLEVLRSLADHVILELPFEPNACGQQLVQQATKAELPPETVLLGYGQSHLAEGHRQIVLLSRPKTKLTKSYLGTPRTDLSLTIHSDFANKFVEFHNKAEKRPWFRGINLQTYLWFNGAYPPKPRIAEMVANCLLEGQQHRDVQPWNFILQGEAIQLIDRDDPNHAFAYNDRQYRDRLLLLLQAESLGQATLANLDRVVGQARLEMPVRWRGPIFNPSGYASEAINYILPLAEKVNLGILHLNNLYSAKFVAGLGEADRAKLFQLRDKYPMISGGITIDHNPANGFQIEPTARYRIGRSMFETDRISADWVTACNQMDEIWVPSRFNLETFAASGVERRKLMVMPESVDENEFNPEHHQPLALPNRAAFNFLSIFEWSTRKGWDVLLAAYLREFTAEDDVCLYVRTYLFSKPDGDPATALWKLIRDYAATLNLGDKKWPRIELLAEQVPQADLPRLYKAADCLVAPSRGEGWGRPHHEAMLMGLPVIATNWSGNTEFMTKDNSYLIDYEIVPTAGLEPELAHYQGHCWANPSEADLRRTMRHVQKNPAEAQKRGALAREHMLRHYTRGPVTNLLVQRLQEIERQLTVPNCPPVGAKPSAMPAQIDQSTLSTIKVNWEGSFLDFGSLSHVNRSMTTALSAQSRLELACVGSNTLPRKHAGIDALQKLARRIKSTPPAAQVTVRQEWPPQWDPPATGAWVLIQPWEFGVLPADWVTNLEAVDEIWAISEYNRRVYVDSGILPAKVKVVPNGIDPNVFRPEATPLALATQKKFKFLFVGGTIHRKGPDILLDAYLNTFTAQDDVCLVIKDFGANDVYQGQTIGERIRAAQAQPDAPEILYLTDELPPESLPGLYTACQCLVHPYRGEGFGLPVLEAMACGLAVVVTGGGSTDDFATDEFAYRLPALRENLGASVDNLKLVRNGWWLEPDHTVVSSQMKWIYDHPNEAAATGRAASRHVREHWTWERAAQIARGHLHNLAVRKHAELENLKARRDLQNNYIAKVSSIGTLHVAREFLAQKQLEAAWQATMAALSVRPFHPDAWLLLAEIARVAGNGNVARHCAHHARQLAPRWKAPTIFLSKSLKGAAEFPWLNPSNLAIGAPRLSVCLIVKNEEKFLPRCLQSVQGLASQIIVIDTGSTDHTVEIARSFNAEIHFLPWSDDFAAARNAALEHATGEWVLMLDADEELPATQHGKLREHMNNSGVIGYRLPLVNVGQEAEGRSFVPRLFRNVPGAFYRGRIHEQVFASLLAAAKPWGLEAGLGSAELLHYGYTTELVRDRNKVERNLKLLRQATEECPDDSNLVMNLGMELVRSGNLRAGLRYYTEAFNQMSRLPADEVVPELREVLLTQFTSHLYKLRAHSQVVQVLTSPLARTGGLTASLHFALGLACFELKQYREAADQMRQCLASREQACLTPINTDIRTAAPHHCLALCLLNAGDLAGAEQSFNTAVAASGHVERARMDYARFLRDQKRPVEALQQLHTIVRLNPRIVEAWHLGGTIALGRSEFLEFALDWTAEAHQQQPENPHLALQRAEALLLNGRTAEAARLWESLWRSEHQPVSLAALILCEILDGVPTHATKGGSDEQATSLALVQWYQRMISLHASATLTRINSRIRELSAVLPTAAGMLEVALAPAEEVVSQ